MKHQVLAFAMAMIVASGLVPSVQAHSQTGTYTIGTTPVVSLVCSPDCLGTDELAPGSGINLGGYTFAGGSEVPLRVDIADASGGPVSFTVCQDFNEALCGESGVEPRVVGCGTVADLTLSTVPFTAGADVSVFIRAASPDCLGGYGLGGTVTLTYAH